MDGSELSRLAESAAATKGNSTCSPGRMRPNSLVLPATRSFDVAECVSRTWTHQSTRTGAAARTSMARRWTRSFVRAAGIQPRLTSTTVLEPVTRKSQALPLLLTTIQPRGRDYPSSDRRKGVIKRPPF
jgi:hypothetical protein